MDNTFIALDGDNVGQKLEFYMFTNDIEQLKLFSLSFARKMEWLIGTFIKELDAEVIFCGGDNLLVNISKRRNTSDLAEVLKLLFLEFADVGHTVSAGIGNTPREALIALKFAKSSGKNCIKVYGDYGNGKV